MQGAALCKHRILSNSLEFFEILKLYNGLYGDHIVFFHTLHCIACAGISSITLEMPLIGSK